MLFLSLFFFENLKKLKIVSRGQGFEGEVVHSGPPTMSTGETASGGDKTGPPPEALKGPALKEKIAAILKDADLEQVKKGWIVVFSTSPVFSKKIIKTQGRLNSRFS